MTTEIICIQKRVIVLRKTETFMKGDKWLLQIFGKSFVKRLDKNSID